ncbi:RagB/SusD family nutrient uptake outer membrane protein [Pseudopedobacter beijingensis]|uniref:RagB/SusD family nutrient uptake outer membrane protein n=1 Tax=Pseudopedobacter beijingensis TaxID=1207056 RepID=A0ABW4I893_9SPHI
MKKIINKYLSGLLFIVSFSSCENFLDTKPLDKLSPQTFFQTEAQLDAGLTATYDALSKGATYGYSFATRYATEADEGFFYSTSRKTGPQFYDFTSSDAEVLSTWTALYNGISRANLVLENVDKPVMDETTRKEIKGQALFLRAYYYFLLVMNWGDVPLILKTTESVEGNSIPRSSSAQVYEQITKDMIEAEALVPSAAKLGFGGRVSKSAVRGILARVYLYWAGYPLKNKAKYEDVRFWAKKVMDDIETKHKLSTSYEDVFIKYAKDQYDIGESIFEVEFSLKGTWEHGQIGSWIGIRSTSDKIGTAYGFIGTTAKLYKLYKTGDLRRDRAISPFYYDANGNEILFSTTQLSRRYPGKWRRAEEEAKPKRSQNTPINFPILRFSDVLLMFAEADNEINNGPTNDAYDAINKVRRRAYGLDVNTISNTVDLQNMDYTTFLLELKDERSRELCFEALRKYDLIRWNDIEFVLNDMKREVLATESATYNYVALSYANFDRSKHTLLPIPLNDMSLNKMLTQNPGY